MYQNKVITINEGQIFIIDDSNINISKEEYLNTTIWNISCSDEIILNNYTNVFIKKNERYVISYNNLPLEKLVVNELVRKNYTISFAESCTGGMLASTLVNVSGASNVFEQSFVTYSNESKIKQLNVRGSTISKYSVYSSEVAEEMVIGLYNKTKANICVSVTGRAGGDEYQDGDGSCDFAIFINDDDHDYLQLEHYHTHGSRNEVRKMQTTYIFWRILLRMRGQNKAN